MADAARFGREIPGARVVILDGCGHMPQEERPVELVRLLQEFLPDWPSAAFLDSPASA